MKKKRYTMATVDVVRFDAEDVIRTSLPVSGEDGNDIFDDR